MKLNGPVSWAGRTNTDGSYTKGCTTRTKEYPYHPFDFPTF